MVHQHPRTFTPMHRAALEIAGEGKPVFPCEAGGKRPLTPNGFKDATADASQINEWWERWPEANVGIRTGKASGLLILDIDPDAGGHESLEALEAEHGPLPETTRVRTGRGGLHIYLHYPTGIEVRNSAGKLGPGLDVRGEGGYIVAPGSVTVGAYEWLDRHPLADDAPAWLLEALRDEPRSPSEPWRTRLRTSIPDDGGPIPEGARDQTLTSIAGRLHDGRRDLTQLEADLQAVNESRCVPPLPAGQVRKVARSVYRYQPCRPARREPDEETDLALAEIERALREREHKGQSGTTDYSIAVAALKLARKYGTLVEDGVRVEVSARQLALAAATSRRTIASKLKSMEGILRTDNENVAPGKSGAIVLLLPRAALHHSTHRVSSRGGCAKWRAPFTAPRLRWSSPPRRARRGVTPGTSKVRDGIVSKKRDAVIRLGKSCERVMDVLEAAGGTMSLSDLAAELHVKRPRDLIRRRNVETSKGRDGFVTRLQDVGVLRVVEETVTLTSDWLEALSRERERAGEIELHERDERKYKEESYGYRNRCKIKADHAPSEEEMREHRESFPERRRAAIEAGITRLFREHPEYRGLRAGQITCHLVLSLPDDFPRGPDGVPKDAEVEALLDGIAA